MQTTPRPKLLFDLDGTLLTSWTQEDFAPYPAPWVEQLLALGEPVAICSNQGGVSWALSGGRSDRRYPGWREILARIRAGMKLAGIHIALVALYHPQAPTPSQEELWQRGREIGLPPELIQTFGAELPVCIFDDWGVIMASWSPQWRKPAPGMLIASRRMIGEARWIYVGNEQVDQAAAIAAAMEYIDVTSIPGGE